MRPRGARQAAGGDFVLCSLCTDDLWESGRAAFAEGLEKTRAALAADPTNDGHRLTVEFLKAALELFESKSGEIIDELRMNAARKRVAELNLKLAALAEFNSPGSKGEG
ncbi:MAG: hypothetical protein M3P29_00695 [Acidobacteriota bacterium]|nr:hypothetical protein [Acidobacteriota bacterium]